MFKLLEDIQITENFSIDEFANHLKDGNYVKIGDISLVSKLQQLRDIVGQITVTSGYRTPEFNERVGGSSNSYHLDGLAADIKFDFSIWNVESLFAICRYCGFTNVTIYMNGAGYFQYMHVDVGAPRKGEEYYRTLII